MTQNTKKIDEGTTTGTQTGPNGPTNVPPTGVGVPGQNTATTDSTIATAGDDSGLAGPTTVEEEDTGISAEEVNAVTLPAFKSEDEMTADELDNEVFLDDADDEDDEDDTSYSDSEDKEDDGTDNPDTTDTAKSSTEAAATSTEDPKDTPLKDAAATT